MGGKRALYLVMSIFLPVVAELFARYLVVAYFYRAPHVNVHSHVIASFSLGILVDHTVLAASIAVAAAIVLGGNPVVALSRSRWFVVFIILWSLTAFFTVQALAKWAEGVAAVLVAVILLIYATIILVIPCSALTAAVGSRACRSIKGVIIAGAAGITALFLSLIMGGTAVRLLAVSPELIGGNAMLTLSNWSPPLIAAEITQVLTYEVGILAVIWAAVKK